MSGVATAVVGGAVLGAVITSQGNQGAADTAAAATTQAAQTQNDATMASIAAQQEMYEQSRADLAPWREAGERSLNTLEEMVSAGPGEFEASPSYNFVRDEGLDAITQSLANMGLNRSGAHAKAAGDYASDLASQEYDNFLSRYYQSLTPYQSLSGVGMTTGTQLGNQATYTGNAMADTLMAGGANVADLITQTGAAQAAGQLGQTNTLANLANWSGQFGADYLASNPSTATTGTTSSYYDMSSGGDNWWAYY